MQGLHPVRSRLRLVQEAGRSTQPLALSALSSQLAGSWMVTLPTRPCLRWRGETALWECFMSYMVDGARRNLIDRTLQPSFLHQYRGDLVWELGHLVASPFTSWSSDFFLLVLQHAEFH